MSAFIDTFLNLEINEYSQKIIFEAIKNARENNTEQTELTFNIYSIVINFKENKVTVSNDLVAEDSVEILHFEEFFNAIKGYEKK